MMSNKLDGMSMDIEQEARERLKSVFPECFAEGKLDIDKLLSMCGEYIDNDFEKYKFEWHGKGEALKHAQRRSAATLRPSREESVDFDTTQNLYIEGDNLEVLKLLQTAYFRQVKMIYIDPPYNTGNDFVYEDDFADPLAKYLEVTSQATKSNPETMGRFHTAWLNMMYPRLRLAANLLRNDGVIFVSIDDNEVHNLRKLMDEVFGEENFIGDFIWKSRQIVDSRNKSGFSSDHEFILVYCKNLAEVRLAGKPIDTTKYSNPDNDPRGPWMSNTMLGLATIEQRPNLHYPITDPKTGIDYPCNPDTGWRFSKETMAQKIADERIIFPKDPNGRPREKKFLNELESSMTGVSSMLPENIGFTLHGTKEVRELFDDKYFDFPKPVELIKFFLGQSTSKDDGDIILDFFSGSGTTAHAVMQLNAEDGGNRRFICVQLPETTDEKSEAHKAGYKNICEIGKERIRRAGAKIRDEAGMLGDNLDMGFKVFKLDSSNLKLWDGIPTGVGNGEQYFAKIRNVIDGVKDDRPAIDVVYELMLKLGVPITEQIEEKQILDKMVYSVDGDLLLFCLEYGVTAEFVEALADLSPAKIILAEQGFADDTAMANAHYILQDRGIEMKLV